MSEFVDPALAEAGKIATIRLHGGGEITGTLVKSWRTDLRLDDPDLGLLVVIQNCLLGHYIAGIVSLTDPKPTLPTEPGSVILDAVVRGERVPVVWCDGWWSNGEIGWRTPNPVNNTTYHRSDQITEFTPATVVATAELEGLRSELNRLGGVITPEPEPEAVLDRQHNRWNRTPEGRYRCRHIVRRLAEVDIYWGPLTDATTGEPVTP